MISFLFNSCSIVLVYKWIKQCNSIIRNYSNNAFLFWWISTMYSGSQTLYFGPKPNFEHAKHHKKPKQLMNIAMLRTVCSKTSKYLLFNCTNRLEGRQVINEIPYLNWLSSHSIYLSRLNRHRMSMLQIVVRPKRIGFWGADAQCTII